jgi:type IV pilus assembly protein PilF
VKIIGDTKLVVIAAFLLTGCAVEGPATSGPNRSGNGDMDTSGIIAEQGPPRERARIHTELAAAYYERGSIAIALEEIRIAIAADPTYALAYNVLALLHADLRENDQAQLNFERALRLNPADADINHNYGWFLCQIGREDQALKYFEAAVRNPLYPTPQKSYVLAATCALRKNLEKEALDYYERALKLDPNYLAALMGLAQLKFRTGSLVESRSLLSRYNKQIEPTAESLWLALRVERRLGNKAAESALAAQLRRQYPGSTQYQELLKGQFD